MPKKLTIKKMADDFLKWWLPIELERMDRELEFWKKWTKKVMKKNKNKKNPQGKSIIWKLYSK